MTAGTAAAEWADTPMRHPDTSFMVRIGIDVFPVRGNAERGWKMDASETAAPAEGCWYSSLDELVFVLINLSVATDGTA